MKFTPILISILIILVVSISGCITVLDSDNNTTISDSPFRDSVNNFQTEQAKNDNSVIKNFNNSGNIIVATEENSKNIKKDMNKENNNPSPLISKEEIEKETIRILKLDNNYLNFSANAELVYDDDKTAYYIVDVYDDYGWFGFFEVDANKGFIGNDEEGYSCSGGAFRGETGDEPRPIEGIMPKLSDNNIRKIMDEKLHDDYSIDEATYDITGFIENNTPYYNVSINEVNKNSDSENIGFAIIDANTGEIINISLINEKNVSKKVFSVDEAGDYVDITYKGIKISVRENYPYYSPQNDKIYYSQEEEAEDLYQMARSME